MINVAADNDYRKILRRELETRCQKNARYSLRSFAKDLQLSPSRLSEVLNGKQGLSRDSAQRVASSMGLSTLETEMFCDLVESQHARGKLQRELAMSRLEKVKLESQFATLQLDTFQAIADWHHLVILSLLGLPNARNDVKWIAKALDISETEASQAVQRLKRLGLVKIAKGKITVVHDYLTTGDSVPESSLRKLHHSLLERARIAHEVQPATDRGFSAMYMRIEKKRMTEAKRWIKSFRRRFCRKITELSTEPDSVYCLAIQFFNLTHSMPTAISRSVPQPAGEN